MKIIFNDLEVIMKKIKTLSVEMDLEDYVFLQRLGYSKDKSPSQIVNSVIEILKNMPEEDVLTFLKGIQKEDNDDIGDTGAHKSLYMSGIGDKQIYGEDE